jgi:PIN domain nuclease of toxin-antitoxin system
MKRSPMKRYVTDTQCLLWYLSDDRRLPKSINRIFDLLEEGRVQVVVPSIVLVEAIFLLQRQRIAHAALEQLLALSESPSDNIYIVPLDMQVVVAINEFGPAAIPELADRVIAATARAYNLPLLTTDHIIIESKLIQIVE